MTALACIFHPAAGEPAEIDEMMASMDDAFDPAFGEAWTRSQCLGILGMPGVWLTLARTGGGACGFALARVIADEAELLLLAVRRAHRRTGVGAALLDAVAVDACRRGAAKLFLEVRAGNPAHALYRGRGFAEVGRRPDYYRGADGSRHAALTLSRGLSTGSDTH